MANEATISCRGQSLVVSGCLNFATVMSVWKNSLPLLAKNSKLHFDLSQVTTANSAGLALLLEWVKWAKQQKKSIQFDHIPPQLLSVAEASGVEKLLSSH